MQCACPLAGCRSAFVGVGGGKVAAVCLLVVAFLSISIRVASPVCAALWFHLLFDDDGDLLGGRSLRD